MAKGGGGDNHLRASAAGMVLIRLFLGGFFLFSAIQKVMEPEKFIAYLKGATASGGAFVSSASVWPAFASFLIHTVHHQAELFAWLVIVGELLVGVLLVLGLLTRLAALIGMMMNGMYLLATMHLSAASLGVNVAFIVMELAVLIAAAGRTWGIDRAIARKTKYKLLW